MLGMSSVLAFFIQFSLCGYFVRSFCMYVFSVWVLARSFVLEVMYVRFVVRYFLIS